jgi:RimJ/RimL family protein N-acetyltransferase
MSSGRRANQLINDEELRILFRPAQESDCEMLFAWRNDDLSRQMSVSTEIIDLDTHREWFQNSLSGADREIWLAYREKSKPFGTVRVDFTDKISELSWTIAPDFRGQGLGKKMVSQFLNDFPGEYIARVKQSNGPSINLVRELCFSCLDNHEISLWKISSGNIE